MTAQMAPYLLLGFTVAGILSLVLTRARVQRAVGGRGWIASLKAVLIGIPVPLCSCSVIPVTVALRKYGAGPGAATAFLTATPQTGVDSILATHALMGPWFAAYRVLAAFISGMVAGVTVDALDGNKISPSVDAPEKPAKSCCCSQAADASTPEPDEDHSPRWLRALRFGFFELPGDIGIHLMIGLGISGIIGATVPPDVLSSMSPPWYLAYALATAIGLPLYVCSTASIPIASAMIASGLSPGAALVFLITGPATNAATIATATRMIGGRGCVVYVGSLIVTSWAMGLIADAMPFAQSVAAYATDRHAATSVAHQLAAVALAILLIVPIVARFRRKPPCGCS